MRKESVAVKYGDPLPPRVEEKPRGNVILPFQSLYKRVQEALGRQGHWCIALESPRTHWTEELKYTVYVMELKDGARVTLVPDLEAFARGRDLIEDCERCFGPGYKNCGAD
jgi:hypothetical protein